MNCLERERWYQNECRPLKNKHPLLDNQGCRTWILKNHYTRPSLRQLSDNELIIIAKSYDIPTKLFNREFLIEEIFRLSTYLELVKMTRKTKSHLEKRLHPCATSRQSYFEQCDGKDNHFEDSGHKEARTILNGYLKNCQITLEKYDSMIHQFDMDYKNYTRKNKKLIEKIRGSEKIETYIDLLSSSDDEISLEDVPLTAFEITVKTFDSLYKPEMEEVKEEVYEEDEEYDKEKMQRLLEQTLARKKRREEKLKQKIANQKAADLIFEKLRNEKKEKEYNQARKCYIMADHARKFITNAKNTDGLMYKLDNNWLVQFMSLLKTSQNGVSNATHAKYNEYTKLLPQLRYIPFVKMDEVISKTDFLTLWGTCFLKKKFIGLVETAWDNSIQVCHIFK